MLDNLIKINDGEDVMSALLCYYLILLPQRQLWLLLLQFLRTVHHKVDDVDAAGQRQQHQDVGYDAKADQNCPEDTQNHTDQKESFTKNKHSFCE